MALVPVASADPLQTVDYTSEDGAWERDGVLKIDVQSGLGASGADVTFVQHCGSPDGPATRGEVHFNA